MKPEPWAWGIEFQDGRRAAILDFERALQLAAHHGGQLVNLYTHPPARPVAPQDVATAIREERTAQ